jgi:hypothetical protein
MPRYAFCDPAPPHVLRCHGFVDANVPGQLRVEVPDDFAGRPDTVQYDPDAQDFAAYEAPPAPPSPDDALASAIERAATLNDVKAALLARFKRAERHGDGP